jgi:hypothetical protein
MALAMIDSQESQLPIFCDEFTKEYALWYSTSAKKLISNQEFLKKPDLIPTCLPFNKQNLDAFFAEGEGGLKFTEFNAETPAGAAYNDALSRAFLALPVMQAFQRTHLPLPIPAAASVIDALLQAYHAWRGVREKPQVCILDWKEVPTSSEFVLYEQAFRALGIDVFIGDPRDAAYANGRLTVAGKPVTLIYKRVLIDELITQSGLDSPVVQAVKDGAVCMVNPFRCKLLHKKASHSLWKIAAPFCVVNTRKFWREVSRVL